MRRALKDRLAGYKMPQEMKVLEGVIPRNAMGKGEFFLLSFCFFLQVGDGLLTLWDLVNKKTLVKEVFGV